MRPTPACELEEVPLMEQQWTAEQQAWLDVLDGKTYQAMPDGYAGRRCVNCHPHMVYAGEEGQPCRACGCTDHRTKADAEGSAVA